MAPLRHHDVIRVVRLRGQSGRPADIVRGPNLTHSVIGQIEIPHSTKVCYPFGRKHGRHLA
jgi:hypothetical protein